MVLVEVMRKAYLASIVPVIVNAVLNEHQLVVDIVAFVSKGDFPRSRLGEKQRGKILASWVTRKMKTIAQFGIRDADGADSQITEVAEPRSGVGSIVAGGSSLKNVETITTPQPQQLPANDYTSLPTGVSEMPTPYESSILESPPLPLPKDDDNKTPTETQNGRYLDRDDRQYSTRSGDVPQATYSDFSDIQGSQPYDHKLFPSTTSHNFDCHDPEPESSSFDFKHAPRPPPPRLDSKATLSRGNSVGLDNDLYTLPSQQLQPREVGKGSGGGGRLRATNADINNDEEGWPPEAIMHMNMRASSSPESKKNGVGGGMYDGSGYGHAL